MMDSQVPIAVVGLSCRFPGGASSPEKFWEILCTGQNVWSKVPADRYNADAFYHGHPENDGTSDAYGAHFLDQDISTFDASFFGISPVEAAGMDPQQRLQLESTYEALESAGISLEEIKGSNTAVYIATFAHDYEVMQFRDTLQMPKYTMTGTGTAIAANRISYTFDLRGPSLTLDTGCSGSMVALHQACQSLRTKESDMGLIGATNLILSPEPIAAMSNLQVLNKEGQSHPFDTRGKGYGRGEGSATLVLKRLSDALEHGDPIRAVIRGTCINQDGKTNGITLPSAEAQEAMIRKTYRLAGLDPRDTAFFEAHGTGTLAGDKEEVCAIKKVFCEDVFNQEILQLGSVKGNIGHLENASGIAGLIKSILILEKAQIPPTANLVNLKPELELEHTRIQIPTQLQQWTARGPRRISVNGFGYGGTNAHAILEHRPRHELFAELSRRQAAKRLRTASNSSNHGYYLNLPRSVPDHQRSAAFKFHTMETNTSTTMPSPLLMPPTPGDSDDEVPKVEPLNSSQRTSELGAPEMEDSKTINDSPRLFVLSARSEKALKDMIDLTIDWIARHPNSRHLLADLSHTLVRRSHLQWRHSSVASSLLELAENMYKTKRATKVSSASTRINYIFTGQGAQWFGMGRKLLNTESVFSDSLKASEKILTKLGADWSLTNELNQSEAESKLNDSKYGQPASTAIQIAMVDHLKSVGIVPNSVVGHSSGEIAAAYACGTLSHEAALLVSYHRSFLGTMAKQIMTQQGSMLAVGLGCKEIHDTYASHFESGTIVVACMNSPSSVTVSGDEPAILELKTALDAAGVFARQLKVDTAYHSHHMAAVADDYRRSMQTLQTSNIDSTIKYFSSISGKQETSNFGADYWVDNLVSPVNFTGAIQSLCEDANSTAGKASNIFIEIGPHSALAGPTRQILTSSANPGLEYRYVSTLVRGKDAVETVLEVFGTLFEHDCSFDLKAATKIAQLVSPKVLTDLPSYPWDHSTKYWVESRLNRDLRSRENPEHDLLGVRVPGTSESQPSWRHLVNFKKYPWLQEHNIDGFAVFPASSYMCMAIEAAKQLYGKPDARKKVAKYILRNVQFLEMLSWAQPEDTIELQLNMGVQNELKSDSVTTRIQRDFNVSSVTANGIWTEHCKGVISVEFELEPDNIEGSRESEAYDLAVVRKFAEIQASCTDQFDSTAAAYDDLRSHGNFYGTNFALMKELAVGHQHTLSTISIPDIAKTMPSAYQQPHIIHPTTLDAFIHSALPSYFRQCTASSVVTAAVGELIIPVDMPNTPAHELILATIVVPENVSNAKTQISILLPTADNRQVKPVAQLNNVVLQGVGRSTSESNSSARQNDMSYTITWEQNIDHVALPTQGMTAEVKVAAQKKLTLLDTAAAIYISRFLGRVARDSLSEPFLEKTAFYDWMQRWIESPYARSLHSDNLPVAHQDDILEQARLTTGVEGQMLHQVCAELEGILAGHTDPISAMLKDNLLYRLYAEDASMRCYAHLTTFFKSLTYKNPNLAALEIGGGTAGATLPLLSSLSTDGRSVPFSSYDFTDVSSGFFDKARETLGAFGESLAYKVLDINKDPQEQGFKQGSYDVIIASNVLHIPQSVQQTLSYARGLLKPGGRLVMVETIRTVPFLNTIYGILPAWWSGVNHGRCDSPLLGVEQWQEELRASGFGDIEKIGYDFEEPIRRCAMFVAQAIEPEMPKSGLQLDIIPTVAAQLTYPELIADLQGELSTDGYDTSIRTLSQEGIAADKIYVIIDDGERPLLQKPEHNAFSAIAALMNKAKNVLWISLSKQSSYIAESSLFIGFARVARTEHRDLRLLTVDARLNHDESDLVKLTQKILARSFNNSTSKNVELEYEYRDGHLMIPRLVPLEPINESIRCLKTLPQPKATAMRQLQYATKLEIGTTGVLDTLRWIPDTDVKEELDAAEVEIEVETFGLNFKDVALALGQHKSSSSMMGEFAGIVKQVGNTFQTRFRPGDRVYGFGSNPYAPIANVNGNLIQRVPGSLSFEQAASVPVNFTTAYYALVEVAGLEADQTVLISASSSGGIDQAAIKVAKSIGAQVFVTVNNIVEKDLLINEYDIPDEHIFSTRSSNLKTGIHRLTNNQGVDVVLSCSNGQLLQDIHQCVAPFGTLAEVGRLDKTALLELPDNSVTFATIDIAHLAKTRPQKINKILTKVTDLFMDGSLSATKFTTIPISNIEEAFRSVQGKQQTGKIVLNIQEDSLVKVLPKPATLQFGEHSTYIIAGGLGGLGYEICRWMGEHGAKHIVLLSRRALSSEQQTKLREEFIKYGGLEVLAAECDITSITNVQRLSLSGLANLPPVRGIIQSAMVLKDIALEEMTAEDFDIPMDCKVAGTRNLLSVFQTPHLSHFIMLSSVSSITGNALQANYSAANAYLDALARHASAEHPNVHFMSLNLGPMKDVGVVANNKSLENYLVRQGYIPVRLSELFVLLRYAFIGEAKQDGCNQIIIGFNRASLTASDNATVLDYPTFSHIPQIPVQDETTNKSQVTAAGIDIKDQLAAAKDPLEKRLLAAKLMATKVASLLALDVEKVELDSPLMDMGLDSLVLNELKNWITHKMGAPITVGEMVLAFDFVALADVALAKIPS